MSSRGYSRVRRSTCDGRGRRPLSAWKGLRPSFDRRLGRAGRYGILPAAVMFYRNLSNSPFRTPPRNACHSPGVNRRTGPAESLLSRTPISPAGRLATSTQLLLEKLRELLTQYESESGLPGRLGVSLSTSHPSLIVV